MWLHFSNIGSVGQIKEKLGLEGEHFDIEYLQLIY